MTQLHLVVIIAIHLIKVMPKDDPITSVTISITLLILFCCFRISHKKSILYLCAQFLNCASISSKPVQSRINAYSSFVANSAQKLSVSLLLH